MYQMIWYRHLGERWNPRQINSSKSKSKVQNNIEMGHYRWDPSLPGSRAKHAQRKTLKANGKVPRHSLPASHSCPEIARDAMAFIKGRNSLVL